MQKNFCGIAAVLLALSLIISSAAGYYSDCRELRGEVLRLHITANSDSEADQTVKLKVRDALLSSGAEIFSGSVTAADAEEKLSPQLEKLKATADIVLKENGFDYTSRAYIVKEYFDTREYDGVTLPAGEYTALRVALGTGEGKNWWCVMFPPLCLPAAVKNEADDVFSVFEGNGTKVVRASGGYKVRFKLVEAAEKLMERLREKK